MSQYRITQFLRIARNDIAWMGIWGLWPGQRGRWRFINYRSCRRGSFDDDVAAIDSDGDHFWILGGGAMACRELSAYDRSQGEWEYFDSRRDREIVSDQFYAIRT